MELRVVTVVVTAW